MGFISNKSVLKAISISLLILFLYGCASVPNKITKVRPFSSYPPEYGVIVGSFTVENDSADVPFPFSSGYNRTFLFRNLETNEEYHIDGSHSPFASGDFPNGDTYAYALPAGEYVFYDFSVNVIVLTTMYYQSPKEKFSIPFSVKPRQVLYLGEIKAVPKRSEFLGVPIDGHFVISDQYKRDVPVLKKKHPEINWNILENATLRSGEGVKGLVLFK